MLYQQIQGRGISNKSVIDAMNKIPRHEFVPVEFKTQAYADGPLPIGYNQTISQPYIVALMTQLACPNPTSRALDVGTGSGYQAAVLAEIVDQVYSIEIVDELAVESKERLSRLGYHNIFLKHGDGYQGWPEFAPFDIIIVAAAPDHIPEPLCDQLAIGGRLLLPVGDTEQHLTIVEKTADGTLKQSIVSPVAFVPMTGEAQKHSSNENS